MLHPAAMLGSVGAHQQPTWMDKYPYYLAESWYTCHKPANLATGKLEGGKKRHSINASQAMTAGEMNPGRFIWAFRREGHKSIAFNTYQRQAEWEGGGKKAYCK